MGPPTGPSSGHPPLRAPLRAARTWEHAKHMCENSQTQHTIQSRNCKFAPSNSPDTMPRTATGPWGPRLFKMLGAGEFVTCLFRMEGIILSASSHWPGEKAGPVLLTAQDIYLNTHKICPHTRKSTRHIPKYVKHDSFGATVFLPLPQTDRWFACIYMFCIYISCF